MGGLALLRLADRVLVADRTVLSAPTRVEALKPKTWLVVVELLWLVLFVLFWLVLFGSRCC